MSRSIVIAIVATATVVGLAGREAWAQVTYTPLGSGPPPDVTSPPPTAAPPPTIPIRGTVGADGAYHSAVAPAPRPAATVRPPPSAVGGGPRDAAGTLTATPPAAPRPVVAPPPPVTVVVPRVPRNADVIVVVPPAAPPVVTVVRMVDVDRPRLLLGIAAGGGQYLGDAPRSLVGPTWTASLGVQLARAFGLEVRYQGASNFTAGSAQQPVGVRQLTSSVVLMARLTVPTRILRPFVQAGVGWYGVEVFDDPQRTGGARSGSSGVLPVGGGLELTFHPAWSFTTEFNYNFRTPVWSDPDVARNRGEMWSVLGGFRFYL